MNRDRGRISRGRIRWLLGFGLVVVLSVGWWAALAARRPAAASGVVVLSSGSHQGVYFEFASELARQLRANRSKVSVQVEPSGGSVQNLQRLDSGAATCAVTAADAASLALAGEAPFARRLPVRAVARIYDDYIQLVTRADAHITSIQDLGHARAVSLGEAGSGVRLVATRVLAAQGMRLDGVHDAGLGLADSITALEQGRIDAFFWSGGLPTPSVQRLFATAPVSLVPLGPVARGLVRQFGFSYRAATVPAGTYGLPEAVDTVAVANFVVCRADVSDAAVGDLLATLFRHQDAIARAVPPVNGMDVSSAIATEPVPLHPGALAWFRRTKP